MGDEFTDLPVKSNKDINGKSGIFVLKAARNAASEGSCQMRKYRFKTEYCYIDCFLYNKAKDLQVMNKFSQYYFRKEENREYRDSIESK